LALTKVLHYAIIGCSMKHTQKIQKAAQLLAEGLTETQIIAQLGLEIKWARELFKSKFFKAVVKMRKKNENRQ
jgi:hypothetical protein